MSEINKMKKLLVGAAFVALGTFSAQAADLAVRPHRTVEPAYNWSGI
jgi:opacity protein-like surface antigen